MKIVWIAILAVAMAINSLRLEQVRVHPCSVEDPPSNR